MKHTKPKKQKTNSYNLRHIYDSNYPSTNTTHTKETNTFQLKEIQQQNSMKKPVQSPNNKNKLDKTTNKNNNTALKRKTSTTKSLIRKKAHMITTSNKK